MSTVTHRCQWCDGDYPCHTMEAVSEGVYRCQCKAVDECLGCSAHGACEHCGERPAGDEREMFLCTPCADVKIDNYSGPDDADYGGVSLSEQMDAAYTLDRRLR